MKIRFFILSIALCFTTMSGWANYYPEALAVHPTENIMVMAHGSGNLVIFEKSTYKHIKTIKVLSEIKTTSFSRDGMHLWVHGTDSQDNDVLLQLNSSTWEKSYEIECDEVAFSSTANKVAYKKDFFATDIKIIDLTTAESVGAMKMSFSKENAKVDFFEFSTDGKKLLMAENAYGENPCEILIYPSEGFVSTPLLVVTSPSKISTGFGTGLCSAGEEFTLIGWSETIKIVNGGVEVIDRGYHYCHSFCSSPDGQYFFVGSSIGRAVKYDRSTMKKTELGIEEMKGVTGDIIGITTTDGVTYHFLTDEYIVGTINADGFVLKQNFISMNVNVILDSYEPKEVEDIKKACKANGCNVEIPEEYDEENPVIISSNISINAAYALIEKMDEADIYCLVSIME